MARGRASNAGAGSFSGPMRLVLPLLVVAGIVVYFVERSASSAASRAYSTLLQHAPDEGDRSRRSTSSEILSPERVQELVGREPASSSEGVQGESLPHERYRWKGLFRTHTLYVVYAPGAPPVLEKVALNAPLDAAWPEAQTGAAPEMQKHRTKLIEKGISRAIRRKEARKNRDKAAKKAE